MVGARFTFKALRFQRCSGTSASSAFVATANRLASVPTSLPVGGPGRSRLAAVEPRGFQASSLAKRSRQAATTMASRSGNMFSPPPQCWKNGPPLPDPEPRPNRSEPPSPVLCARLDRIDGIQLTPTGFALRSSCRTAVQKKETVEVVG
jgi:hypothetical protein